MNDALRHGFVASFVVVGCVVAGVEIDPSLGEVEAGAGGEAGDSGQGGSTGGNGGTSGGMTGGQGGTSQGGKGGTNQGGTDSGGTDSGGTDSGGTDAGGSGGQGGSPAGTGPGGTAGSGPPGGAGPGGTGAGGTAGSGGTGGSAGGASCVGIKSNSPCTQDDLMCPNLPCGLADSGRRTCTCMVNWSCTPCNFASGRFATQPGGITICGAGVADEVACGDTNAVCGPQSGEFCACYTDPADGMIWDCDVPPSTWGCTGSSVLLMITGGTTAHDHLPLTPAETVDMIAQVRAATNGVSLTLPMDGGHTHALVLSTAQLATLRGGSMVSVVSSTFTGHNHTYSLQCGP
jgi:hypothetical protein